MEMLGHVRKTNSDDAGVRMLRLELPAKRPWGRPERKFVDVVKEEKRVVGVMEEDAEERIRGRQMTLCGKP